MEFLGLSTEDFDFFRKKDKMSKAEYEKSRNEVKHHFRGLCYELQKIYHKKTDGVLKINKEFPNFNKRSMNIDAQYGEKVDGFRQIIEMNTENVCTKLILEGSSEESSKLIIDILKNKKNVIWDYLLVDKHNQINTFFKGKGNKIDTIKYNSLDINTKNYDAFLEFIETHLKSGKYDFEVALQHTCPKDAAIKQSKNLSNVIYGELTNISELYTSLV